MAVLFRAYAQRVLRESLLQDIETSDMFLFLKTPAEELVASSDPLVLAYDRAIRSQVDQYGNIDRAKLEAGLKNEMAPMTAVPDSMKDSLIGMLESGGFFEKMATLIQQNGELFGAYRAVGQGGIADRVMKTFSGSTRYQENHSESQANSALARCRGKEYADCCLHGRQRVLQQRGKGADAPGGNRLLVRQRPLLHRAELRFGLKNGDHPQSVGTPSRSRWDLHSTPVNLLSRLCRLGDAGIAAVAPATTIGELQIPFPIR